MKYIVFPHEAAGACNRRRLGGKAAALSALHGSSVSIPDWFVVTPQAFADSLGSRVKSARSAGANTSPTDEPLPGIRPGPEVVAEIEQAIIRLGPQGSLFAVRSSAVDEDGAGHSFAGQFESYLSVPAERIAEKVAAVWHSCAGERVRAYRRQLTLGETPTVPAVLIQRMVDADAAGIAFSADPVSGDRDARVVTATPGLADRLAAGEIPGDTFHVDTAGEIVSRQLANTSPSLSDNQVQRVAGLASRMERYFGCHQDIEWAFENDSLYLLQSRAITSLPAQPKFDSDAQALRLWDNSNIVESYSGVTTPLTFSFARRAYQGVYKEFARIMGVSEGRIADNSNLFRNMLGLIQGRVYYDLMNWYRLLVLFPGFALNRRFMEQMMGVSDTLPPRLIAKVTGDAPSTWRARALDIGRLAKTLLGMIKNRILLERKIAAFDQRLNDALAGPSPSLADLSLDGLVEHYRSLERRLLTTWDAPLINDFFCMIAFGLLGGVLKKLCGEDADHLRNHLLTGQGGIISTEPVRRIREMAALAAGDPRLVRILTEGAAAEAEAAIGRRPKLKQLYKVYLEKFQDRCLGELKLESPTLHEDPLPLLRAIGSGAATHGPERGRPGEGYPCPEQTLARHLKGRPVWRWLTRLVAREAQARVRDRENLRFQRTRVFGRARRIFLELGSGLHAAGVLEDPHDVFYLGLNEVLGFVEGTATNGCLATLARVRKEEFDSFQRVAEPPSRFFTTGAPSNGRILRPSGMKTLEAGLSDDQRRGIGCCAGVVRGVVRVVCNPHEAEFNDSEILVAEYTDPGWITLFSRAAGLLVARGSLLSHSAIVAREMGIPAIVSLADVTGWLQDGEYVEMDGATGLVTRLGDAAEHQAPAA